MSIPTFCWRSKYFKVHGMFTGLVAGRPKDQTIGNSRNAHGTSAKQLSNTSTNAHNSQGSRGRGRLFL